MTGMFGKLRQQLTFMYLFLYLFCKSYVNQTICTFLFNPRYYFGDTLFPPKTLILK